ncbi:MAG: DUF3592 domain-containing protein [Bdellovibrionales bacterium]|nr:DUF3592 domain-containing protein [Bdellovibrionales bacterium]
MVKIAGLIFAALAALFWVRARLALLKTPLTKVQSVPTGVKRATLISIGVLSILGPAVLIYGGRDLLIEVARAQTWLSAVGTVAHLEDAGVHKGRTQYRVAFTFTDQNGETRSALSADRLTSPPAIGSHVAIHYNPANSTEANLNNPFYRFGMPSLFTLLGLVLFGFAIMAGREVLRLNALKPLATSSPLKPTRLIEGRLIKSKKNIFLSLKHQSCWQLHVEYHDQAGRRFNTVSEPIWERNPSEWSNIGIPVPLILDSSAPARAWVQVQEYFKICQQQLRR